jgi:GNAT superfamily N-acetyltransferase
MAAREGSVRPSATSQSAIRPIPTSEPFTLPPAASQLDGVLKLRDGAAVRVRAITPDDTPRLRAFHAQLSRDTIILRYFHYMRELSEPDADRCAHVDYVNRMAVVATVHVDEQERIVAVVSYVRIGPDSAEVAFVVADRWQGRGVGTALLLRLAPYARAQGFTTLVAITMSSNLRMLDLLRHCGYPTSVRFEDYDTAVHVDISAPPALALARLTEITDDTAPLAH